MTDQPKEHDPVDTPPETTVDQALNATLTAIAHVAGLILKAPHDQVYLLADALEATSKAAINLESLPR